MTAWDIFVAQQMRDLPWELVILVLVLIWVAMLLEISKRR